MAITQSGLYLQNFVDQFDATQLGLDYATDVIKAALITDTATPDFADATPYFTSGGPEFTNELGAGSGYTTGGETLGGKTMAVNTGVWEWNATDPTWTTSTLTAMAAVIYDSTEVNNHMFCLLDFVNNVSTTSGTFTLDFPANGYIRIPTV